MGHHHHTPNKMNRAFAIAVGLNLVFILFEGSYALLANSMSLLADAGHNMGDVIGLLMAWAANWLLTRPSKENYSYGYKRFSILSALCNAIILIITSTLIAYESINKLMHPAAVNETIVVVVAFIGILINGGTALLFMRGAHDDLNVKAAFIHLAADALISIGVVITGIIILFTGKMWLDPAAGLIIVVFIVWTTWGLFRDSISLMLDAVPPSVDQQQVIEYLHKIAGVTALHDLHIWGLSTKEIALTVHLVVPEKSLSDADYLRINKDLKQQFKIDHATIQVESGHEDFLCERSDTCC